MKKVTTYLVMFILLFNACKINKNETNKQPTEIFLEDMVVKPSNAKPVPQLQVMRPQVADLLHTQLEVSFDYPKQWVYGKATLWFKPYTQKPKELALDAKGFQILRVAVLNQKDTQDLDYTYDGKQLKLAYGQKDSLKLFIQYIAKPSELPKEGGRAITDSRGLYFIDPLNIDPNKPRQIWTQGETEYNSCWFPTIDAPNEKHTQDLFITVDSGEISLSNGLLKSVKTLTNGKHLDHWQQLEPHAPYLTMMAIGNFVVTKDVWRGKEVSYYLEPAYAPHARLIFGKTTEMLDIFSELTGVVYPWSKFSQVVVRDFVSGAMENTSAVLHGEFVQHDEREHLDNPQEDIIAHELFHHWFGDLVTSRSWGHIPLNESFATYGEYLYHEKALGKLEADRVFANNWEAYLRQKNKHQLTPIRTHFVQPDDMFDVVSYQKGSWILHHLRSVIGDSAFFNGMKIYLTQNAFSATDIHDLRKAMEKAAGIDLIPFFNQWFLGKGHPELKVSIQSAKNVKKGFMIEQVQDSSFGLFRLKLPIALHFKDGSTEIIYVDVNDKLEFDRCESLETKELLTWYCDPNGVVPALFKEAKKEIEWLAQVQYGLSYQPVLRAVKALSDPSLEASIPRAEASKILSGNASWFYQSLGLNLITPNAIFDNLELEVSRCAKQQTHTRLSRNARQVLQERYGYDKYKEVFYEGLSSQSYGIIATSFEIIAVYQPDTALVLAKNLESLASGAVQNAIASFYAQQSGKNFNTYFASQLGKNGYYRRGMFNHYRNYLQQQSASICEEALPILINYYSKNSDENKATYFLYFLDQWKQKSTQKAFFEKDSFKEFYEKVKQDN